MSNKYAQIIERLDGYRPRNSIASVIDQQHITTIETQLGYALPSDYLEFLRDYGNFIFEDARFPIYQDNRWEDATLSMFYGSSSEETIADDYLRQLKSYEPLEDDYETEDFEWYSGIHLVRDTPSPVRNMSWPEELLPIGCDLGGNQICLALFGLRHGAVFWWRIQPYEGCQNLYIAAESFDEFMHLLRKEG